LQNRLIFQILVTFW